MENAGIEVLEWPPQSPDLSPIENIWALMTQRIYAQGRSYNNKLELWNAVVREWNSLTAADMATYFSSMHERVVKVLERNGKKIKH